MGRTLMGPVRGALHRRDTRGIASHGSDEAGPGGCALPRGGIWRRRSREVGGTFRFRHDAIRDSGFRLIGCAPITSFHDRPEVGRRLPLAGPILRSSGQRRP